VKHALLKRAVAAVLLAAAMSVPGIVGFTATSANALPISQLQDECRSANGTWYTDYITGANGSRYESGNSCYWKNIDGDTYVDYYDRKGNYKGTG
jgi:hypothetical protein